MVSILGIKENRILDQILSEVFDNLRPSNKETKALIKILERHPLLDDDND